MTYTFASPTSGAQRLGKVQVAHGGQIAHQGVPAAQCSPEIPQLGAQAPNSSLLTPSQAIQRSTRCRGTAPCRRLGSGTLCCRFVGRGQAGRSATRGGPRRGCPRAA